MVNRAFVRPLPWRLRELLAAQDVLRDGTDPRERIEKAWLEANRWNWFATGKLTGSREAAAFAASCMSSDGMRHDLVVSVSSGPAPVIGMAPIWWFHADFEAERFRPEDVPAVVELAVGCGLAGEFERISRDRASLHAATLTFDFDGRDCESPERNPGLIRMAASLDHRGFADADVYCDLRGTAFCRDGNAWGVAAAAAKRIREAMGLPAERRYDDGTWDRIADVLHRLVARQAGRLIGDFRRDHLQRHVLAAMRSLRTDDEVAYLHLAHPEKGPGRIEAFLRWPCLRMADLALPDTQMPLKLDLGKVAEAADRGDDIVPVLADCGFGPRLLNALEGVPLEDLQHLFVSLLVHHFNSERCSALFDDLADDQIPRSRDDWRAFSRMFAQIESGATLRATADDAKQRGLPRHAWARMLDDAIRSIRADAPAAGKPHRQESGGVLLGMVAALRWHAPEPARCALVFRIISRLLGRVGDREPAVEQAYGLAAAVTRYRGLSATVGREDKLAALIGPMPGHEDLLELARRVDQVAGPLVRRGLFGGRPSLRELVERVEPWTRLTGRLREAGGLRLGRTDLPPLFEGSIASGDYLFDDLSDLTDLRLGSLFDPATHGGARYRFGPPVLRSFRIRPADDPARTLAVAEVEIFEDEETARLGFRICDDRAGGGSLGTVVRRALDAALRARLAEPDGRAAFVEASRFRRSAWGASSMECDHYGEGFTLLDEGWWRDAARDGTLAELVGFVPGVPEAPARLWEAYAPLLLLPELRRPIDEVAVDVAEEVGPWSGDTLRAVAAQAAELGGWLLR